MHEDQHLKTDVAVRTDLVRPPAATPGVRAAHRPPAIHAGRRPTSLTRRVMLGLPVAWGLRRLGAPDDALGKKKRRMVVKSFANRTPITIPNTGAGPGVAGPDPSVIRISGLVEPLTYDVNVRLLGVSHDSPEDIGVVLLAPSGVWVMPMNDMGGATPVTDVDLTLDDEAPTALLDAGPLASGAFQPNAFWEILPLPAPSTTGEINVVLQRFDVADPNGDWKLFVNDDTGGNSGSIAGGWELEITAFVSYRKKKKRRRKKH